MKAEQYLARGKELFGYGQLELAAIMLQNAIRKQDYNVEAHYYLGEIRLRQEATKKRASFLKKQ